MREYPETAVADFEPATGRIGSNTSGCGAATLEPYDRRRAGRLFDKYLGDDREAWPETFRGLDAESYRLIRFDPETVVARDQSYPVPGSG